MPRTWEERQANHSKISQEEQRLLAKLQKLKEKKKDLNNQFLTLDDKDQLSRSRTLAAPTEATRGLRKGSTTLLPPKVAKERKSRSKAVGGQVANANDYFANTQARLN